jgi:hypothetical protein
MPRLLTPGLCLAPLLLAACGGDEGRKAVVEACLKDGADRGYCECQADTLAAELSEEDMALMARISRLRTEEDVTAEEAQEAVLRDGGPARLMAFQFALMAPLMKAEQQCR